MTMFIKVSRRLLSSARSAPAMSTVPAPDVKKAAELFQKSWSVYQKMVRSNGFSHIEAYAAVSKHIKSHFEADSGQQRPFVFLDLACGDAKFSTEMLQRHTNLRRYVGVDLSQMALDHASENMGRYLPSSCTRKDLTLGDFSCYDELLSDGDQSENINMEQVVWIGLSLHHLETDDKLSFMKRVAASMERMGDVGGLLLIYEPTLIGGAATSREEHYQRFMQKTEEYFAQCLDPDEWHAVHQHVYDNDMPETSENWLDMGYQAGFASAQHLFTDPFELYSIFAYEKIPEDSP